AAAAALAACCAAGAAHAATPPQAPDRDLSFLKVGSPNPTTGIPRIVDGHGREVLLKGANVDGIVDYYRSGVPPSEALRVPYPSEPAAYANGACPPDDPHVEGVVLCDFDFDQMRAFGFDEIRLNLSWSLLEPQPGKIDTTYIDRIAQVVDWARRQGIYVVLDMHQDAWSKYVYTRPGETCPPPFEDAPGYDGAPAWASEHATPACALNGVRELDPAVAEDFDKLYANVPGPDGVGLQDHYASTMLALARRFHDDPAVAGYEIMNEPHPGYNAAPGAVDATQLFPFYGKVVNTIVGKVPGFRQLFFIEPNAERNVTDQRQIVTPWSAYSAYRNVVYAPHIYTGVFTADQIVASTRFFPSEAGYQSAIDDAKQLGLPLWVGEFGNNPSDDDTILTTHYSLQDKYLLGGALWLWKENQNDVNPEVNWGIYNPPYGRGQPKPKRVALTSRATPMATAGDLKGVQYATNGTFDIRATSPRRADCGDAARASVVFLPRAADGEVVAEGARLELFDRAGSREAYVYPNGGGAYGLRSARPGESSGPLCPAPATVPGAGLPRSGSCIAFRGARFRLRRPHRGRRVRVTAFVDGRRVARRRGRDVRTLVVRHLPRGRRFKLRVVSVTSRGDRIVSVRTYRGCRKTRPRTRTHGHRRRQ
ncbi:MAG TPA: cellulase family glycosylhydrolase, partial [Thermoleophilaceae bacterium]